MPDARRPERVAKDLPSGAVDRSSGSFGPNAWLVDDMFERFVADPSSVSESWREFFADYRPAPVPAPALPLARPSIGQAKTTAPDRPSVVQPATDNGSNGSIGAPPPVVPVRNIETTVTEAVPLRGAA